ncbi:hypothetical protein [Bacteriovorax sp. Seq25_V]|uniref:hypothetical protein n=1 Tax=Bacteriovorax sp. Seq25_V TaxID=1201288 RepID=UPI00038A376C|nr:hypothetical protein [Bacteriovorax sp. Seq25_V]EQC44755.1 hypothetical protein M900_0372 [Bacteriovorax sp. Seq25_V]
MKGLVLLERVVLESISKNNNNVSMISRDIEIDPSIVLSVIARLTAKGLVTFIGGIYQIAQNQIAWQAANRIESVRDEIKELNDNIVDTCFNSESANMYKLQKILLNEKEEKILNSLLNNVESYITNLRNDRKKDKKFHDVTSKQKVIFWGHTSYGQVLTKSLEKVG